ncbi:MAG TPA: hypothetical protein VEU07_10785 [Candidatus Acidoferrum sp.]|nr:hypothetical protein [Candidatus Acidoferrum sp.]
MSQKKMTRKSAREKSAALSAARQPLGAEDLDPILEKLKLLEYGLYGLQQFRRSSGLDDEDIGPFYRLAEEIGGDVLELKRRLAVSGPPSVGR